MNSLEADGIYPCQDAPLYRQESTPPSLFFRHFIQRLDAPHLLGIFLSPSDLVGPLASALTWPDGNIAV